MRAAWRRAAGVLAVLTGTLAPFQAHAGDPPPVRVLALTSDGAWLDPAQAHLAFSREIPQRMSGALEEATAVRFVFAGLGGSPQPIQITSYREDDALLDHLAVPPLSRWPCPPGSAVEPCWATLPVRLTPDRLDRDYAAAKERSLEAALGGAVHLEIAGRALASFRVGAPVSPAFAAYDRLSARLRVRVLRVTAGGEPAIGGDTAAAIRIARDEVAAAGKLWAQCGIDLAGPAGADIEVVDPPPTELLAIGCEAGLPASGGQITFNVADHRVRVRTHAGDAPSVVAARLARALSGLGLHVELSRNQRAMSGASGAIDLIARSAAGHPLTITGAPKVALNTDATLGVCLGEVDLGNGLTHFVESDASAGTLEERALVKAFDDGDPSTIDVFVVPSFDQSGRIGESFIDDDGSAVQNTVIIDRAAVRAGPRSYALAHEIGHILLDMPGHPDDYGVDQSTSLMDADAADASVFGPRRLSLADCERALRESGPTAKIPLLRAWPLGERRARSAPPTSAR